MVRYRVNSAKRYPVSQNIQDPEVTGKMWDWRLFMVRYRVNSAKRYPVSQNIHN